VADANVLRAFRVVLPAGQETITKAWAEMRRLFLTALVENFLLFSNETVSFLFTSWTSSTVNITANFVVSIAVLITTVTMKLVTIVSSTYAAAIAVISVTSAHRALRVTITSVMTIIGVLPKFLITDSVVAVLAEATAQLVFVAVTDNTVNVLTDKVGRTTKSAIPPIIEAAGVFVQAVKPILCVARFFP
jgi:hypothetical protein